VSGLPREAAETVPAMSSVTTLLKTTAVLELATGIGLLAVPSRVAQALAGRPLADDVSLLVARVAGAALLAIGLACALEAARVRPAPPIGLLGGLLAYNGAVALLLMHSAVVNGTGGIGLWPTVVLHVALGVWMAALLRRHRSDGTRSAR
jgi:hypothetical protein